MKCGNRFCIYFEDFYCGLNDVDLGTLGECLQCEYVRIDERILSGFREKSLCGDGRGGSKRNELNKDN